MEVLDMIKLNPSKVRGNPDLMAVYLKEFQSKFGYKPNCAGCTFASDWGKFVRAFKPNTMSERERNLETTFKLYKVGKDIFTYHKDGKPYRKYARKMTEEFAINYLTYGTKEQIEERKKEFAVLPEKFRVENKVKEVSEKETKPKKTRSKKQNNK